MGVSSLVGLAASRTNVNTQFLRSKPKLETLPCVAIGVGRTYASAARNPGFSASVFALCPFGVISWGDSVSLSVEGDTVEFSKDWLCEKEGDCVSKEAVDWLRENGERGSGVSSFEYIDRSSPFHLSPQRWSFYALSATSIFT